MKLKDGGLYTTLNSSLYIKIHKIHHLTDEKISFKGSLLAKSNSYEYETKNYKLPREQISRWIEYTKE